MACVARFSTGHEQTQVLSQLLLACLFESTESYCCHFEVGIGVVVTL